MTIRIFDDYIEFESANNKYILRESSDGFTFTGAISATSIVPITHFQGTVAGYVSGSGSYNGAAIERFPFATNIANSLIPTTSIGVGYAAGQSSSTNGYMSGGYGGYSASSAIYSFSFSNNAGKTSVGTLTSARGYAASQSSTSHGYTSGGYLFIGNGSNIIDKFPFASNSNATDVGDITIGRYGSTGQSSATHGYTSGGQQSANTNIIDKFPFATNANATDVGDLTTTRRYVTGSSSDSHGYTSGGFTATSPYSSFNVIDKFPFATDVNATDVGDLTSGRAGAAGQSSTVAGYVTSGSVYPTTTAVIDKFPFASNANATTVGNIILVRGAPSGHQD